jgi:hypothetical protein
MKRILAILAIILILGLYVWAFISSFFVKKGEYGSFMLAIIASIAVPVLFYIILMTKKWYGKRK